MQGSLPQSGFSLVELMIAMVLGLMVIGSATAVFLSNKQSYRSNNALSQVQENSRIAFELTARDIRQAGLTGCGNFSESSLSYRVANLLNNGPNNDSNGNGISDDDDTWWADFDNSVRGYDGNQADPAVTTGTATATRVAGTDSLQLIGASLDAFTLQAHTAATADFRLNETATNLASGDVMIVCDPDHAVIGQIIDFDGTTSTLTFAADTNTPGNCSRGVGYLTSCATADGNAYTYAPNSQVSRLNAVDWYVGNNAQGGRSLYQMTLGNSAGTAATTAQEMIRNVTDMQIQYLSGGSYVNAAAVPANGWTTVTAIRLSLTLQGNELTTGTDGQPVTRQFVTSIALRNRVP